MDFSLKEEELEPLSEDFLYNPLRYQANNELNVSHQKLQIHPQTSLQEQVPQTQTVQEQQLLLSKVQTSAAQRLPLKIQNRTPPEITSNNSSPIHSPDSTETVKPIKGPTKRRNKPCNQCRVKKVRCIRLVEEQQCKECKKKNQDCEFDKTISYSKVIENYNATCENCSITRTKCIRLPNSKFCLECSIKGLKTSCKFTKGKPHIKLLNTNEPMTEFNNKQQYQGLLTNSLHLQSLYNCIPMNPSSTGLFDKSVIIQKNNNDSEERDISTEFHDEILFKTFKDPEELINLSTQHCDEVERIIQPYGLNLIGLYFKKVQPYYPVINQQVFLEKYSRTHKEINPLLLVVIYLHALKFKHMDRVIRIEESQTGKLENLMELYFLESLHYTNTKFSNIQSYQLLLQYDGFIKSKKLMNELVFVSEELGLNYKNLKIAKWEYETRLKLSWNLKVWDKLISLLEFKSSRINDLNWNLEPLSDIESESSFFTSFIKLIEPLNKILLNLQNQRSYEEDGFPIVSIKYDRCLSSLNDWFKGIQKTKPININDNNSSISLKFLYYLLVFSLDRRVIKAYSDMESISSMSDYGLSDIDSTKYNSMIFPGIKKHLDDFKTFFVNEVNQDVLYDTFWINKRITLTNTLISFFVCAKLAAETVLIDDFIEILKMFKTEYCVLLACKHAQKYYI